MFAVLVTVFGILVSAVVGLTIAYLHRRQMRQIELFKLDPSAGLVPEPNRVSKFVKSKWSDIVAVIGPIVLLVIEFTSSAPITRLTLFYISFGFFLLVCNLALIALVTMESRIIIYVLALLQKRVNSVAGDGETG